MTIAIALQVHDGIVLASDSASTASDATKTGPESVLNVYNNATKIFNLRKGLPIGGITYGIGSIGAASISTLAKDVRKRFSGEDKAYPDWKIDAENFTIEQVALQVRRFLYEENFKALVQGPTRGVQLGFIVAGYSAGAALSEAWLVEIKDGGCEAPQAILPRGETKIYAGGDVEVFSRLVLGYSQKIGAGLEKIGVAPEDMANALKQLQLEMHVQLIEAPMPIQDAIDLAEFFVYATSTFTKFKRGAATVGGPTESAAITKHEGFKWVKRKQYFDRTLNPS